MYAIKEIFYTLQGEGFHAGRPAVFCRFSGCNLWSGREQDRATAACDFCDTDFVGTDGANGGKFPDAAVLADVIAGLWPRDRKENRFVVFTGGEPLLQLDTPLLDAMHARGFECAVETNGTLEAPDGLDWITVSPKGTAPVKLKRASELKLVYPQPTALPERFADFAATHFFLQPMDGPHALDNTRAAVDYCKAHPHWRLSLQTHKYLGIP
ncbi:MAG: 7-carboxy-7-deazaguanine synthase [Xanthomonadales bacterium]|nr:7-carboxy-7-deazaguanine synthase [Xanthomonadales bacterium]ODU95343.1 MAG: 7-carboxy-7-deazaguanine synthase [Rhodanobacter sp. SCN 66-43]OJY83068.1 MAG: 7-carboxy-7-deazaguanine synthase [Xanthomonadales bacterium 66-474]